MRRWMAAIGFLFLAPMGFPTFSGGGSVPLDEVVPEVIKTFYEDYSFIGSLSTRAERNHLVNYLTKGTLLHDFKNERLRKVFALMVKLNSRILCLDPGMRVGGDGRIHLFRSAVVEVISTRISDDEASVEVLVFLLEPESVTRFISAYERTGPQGETAQDAFERKITSRLQGVERREFHTWIRNKGGWFKEEAQLMQIHR